LTARIILFNNIERLSGVRLLLGSQWKYQLPQIVPLYYYNKKKRTNSINTKYPFRACLVQFILEQSYNIRLGLMFCKVESDRKENEDERESSTRAGLAASY
jgi:hypothetical protein